MNEPKNEVELLRQISRLETQNDHVLTELTQLDELLRLAGFSYGIATLKAAATELVKMKNNSNKLNAQ